ncbi:LOW QUALITY PROTEIN: reverse transcriptase, partial [Phytophthora megakarya]
YQVLVTLNRLDEILIPKTENPVVRVAAVTTRASRISRGGHARGLDRGDAGRSDQRAQEEEVWITGMKKYLCGAIADLTQTEARSYGKIAAGYEVDEQDLLFYWPPTPRSGENHDRLVVPETLQPDVLHHYHTTLEEGHQGVGHTYQQIRDHFHWRELYRSVQQYGNTEFLIWIDLFTGYVIAKASSSRSAQTGAESYEECVFRRFGACEMIRHDREPGVMSDFFRAFNKILEQR